MYFQIDPLNCNQEDVLERIKSERGYTYTDVITISRDKLSNYEQKVRINKIIYNCKNHPIIVLEDTRKH